MCMPVSGAWTLEVQSTDAAGNESPDTLTSAWNNTLQPGVPYARILSGPWGPTANRCTTFSVEARPYSLIFKLLARMNLRDPAHKLHIQRLFF